MLQAIGVETNHLITGKKVWIPLGSLQINKGGWSGSTSAAEMLHFQESWEQPVFKTFDFNVAKTGLNMREAEKRGFSSYPSHCQGTRSSSIIIREEGINAEGDR